MTPRPAEHASLSGLIARTAVPLPEPDDPAFADAFDELGGARIVLRPDTDGALRDALAEPRLQRFIGVIYRPDTERWSHYYDARLARQYDRYVFFDRTQAVTPLPGPEVPGSPDTYPYGL